VRLCLTRCAGNVSPSADGKRNESVDTVGTVLRSQSPDGIGYITRA
jgi:hypothetical protein